MCGGGERSDRDDEVGESPKLGEKGEEENEARSPTVSWSRKKVSCHLSELLFGITCSDKNGSLVGRAFNETLL